MSSNSVLDKPIVALRIVQSSDKDFLSKLYASTRDHENVVWSEINERDFLRTQFELQTQSYDLQFPDATHRIITYDNIDVGRVILQEHDDHLHIIDLSILTEYRGRGIATDLLAAFLAHAQGGKVPVLLFVERLNPAMRLYARLGFQKISETPTHLKLEWRPDLGPREV